MYQTIDDDIAKPDLKSDMPKRTRWWLMIPVVMAIALYLIFIYDTESQKIDTANIQAAMAERTSYHSAITEPAAAMRRARLTDFLSTHPQSARRSAIIAQLNVLNDQESKHWADVTEAVFNPVLSREEKITVLDTYDQEWGSSLLGGRDQEIRDLREELSVNLKKFPSRKLTEEKTSVPEDIDGNELVGGLYDFGPNRDTLRMADINSDPDTLGARNIVPPRLKKRSNPRYPRRAYRKGIGALVTVSLDIDSKGRVDDVEIISVEASSYQKDFAKEARKAAKKSRYEPKTINGKPVPTMGHVKRYRFTPD